MKWKFSDFDKTPDLSPDLEWMVQSGQVSRQMFLETLVKNYYARVYRLALSLLNDISAARAVSRDTFAQAALSTHSYRDQVGMDAWVSQIAFQNIKAAMRRENFWRGFERVIRMPGQFTDSLKQRPAAEMDRQIWHWIDQLGDEQRIPLVLRYANGWTVAQIADTLKISQEQVEQLLQSNLGRVAEIPGEGDEDPDQRLRSALERRYPLPGVDEDVILQFTQKVERQTGKRHIFGRGMTTTREIVILGIALVVVILVIWGGNHFLFQSESDAASPGSYLDAGGLGIIQQWMEASLLLIGLGQTASEDSPMGANQRSGETQSGSANHSAFRYRYEDCHPYACDTSWGMYSAFKNKDRIRRFRQSQSQQYTNSAPAETPQAEPTFSSHEPIEARKWGGQ